MKKLIWRCGTATLALASATTAWAQATMIQAQPWIMARPWIVAELPTSPTPPPEPPSPPRPIQGRIPTDPGYPTAPPSMTNPQDAAWASYFRRLADYLQTAPTSDPAQNAALYTYLLAMNNNINNGNFSNPNLRSAAGAYINAYYTWVTRATGSAYGDPIAQQGDAARREAARIQDEQTRITAAAWNRYNQDIAWNRMVVDRFNNSALDIFADNGGQLTTLQLESIYANYDPNGAIPPASSLSSLGNSLSSVGNSLSSAGSSLSAVGWSLSAAGWPVVSGTDDYNDPAVQSLYSALYGLTSGRNPLGARNGLDNAQLADAAYRIGNLDMQADPTGRYGRESGGYLAASLFDQGDFLRRTTINGFGGLNALLSQPFNVLLTWGAGAYDLDLHMTGPLGLNTSNRFHIYYSAPGDLTQQPYAALIKDCICNSGSEVILTSALNQGGVYRISVFDFGDQSATSTNLSNQSQATIQIVRGGHAVSQGNGTTIVGGKQVLSVGVPNGQAGNTWTAAEINPKNGRITVPASITQTLGSANVH